MARYLADSLIMRNHEVYLRKSINSARRKGSDLYSGGQ